MIVFNVFFSSCTQKPNKYNLWGQYSVLENLSNPAISLQDSKFAVQTLKMYIYHLHWVLYPLNISVDSFDVFIYLMYSKIKLIQLVGPILRIRKPKQLCSFTMLQQICYPNLQIVNKSFKFILILIKYIYPFFTGRVYSREYMNALVENMYYSTISFFCVILHTKSFVRDFKRKIMQKKNNTFETNIETD